MRFAACFAACSIACLPVCGGDVPTAASAKSGSPVALSDPPETGAFTEPGHYASVHGLKMYYEVHGKGPALLVLHGGMCSIPVWPEAIEYFSKEYQVIAPEQMGHGRTADDPSRPMEYHAMAEDTAELLRQLKIERTYVLGHSDGGIVGLDLAINHPDLVLRLAVSGANFSPVPPPKPGARVMTADDIPSFIREPYDRLSPDGSAHWPIFFERVQHMWQTQPNFSRGQLAGIISPTLVIAGDHDFVSPEYTVELWRAIPGAELWIAANSTHGLPKKRAPLFNTTVDGFFKEAASTHP
jgi:pimeloyl-ACP methyl ester carboxylesterase